MRYECVSMVKTDILISLPMKHFTPEEFKPSALSLEIIRQIAYSYRPVSNPQVSSYSLN